MSSQEEDDAP
jgi:hypothetical protein